MFSTLESNSGSLKAPIFTPLHRASAGVYLFSREVFCSSGANLVTNECGILIGLGLVNRQSHQQMLFLYLNYFPATLAIVSVGLTIGF